MMYHVKIQPGQAVPLTEEALEIFRTADYGMAKKVADDHRAVTGVNCFVESRATVYTTQTLDEALLSAGPMPDAVAVVPLREGGKRFRSAQSFARAVDALAADKRHVQVGDPREDQDRIRDQFDAG